MPAGTTCTPRTFPRRFAGLSRLPQRKIHGIFFAFVDFDASTRHHVRESALAEFAVIFIFLHAVKNIAVVEHVSKIFFNERLNHLDDIVHRFGDFRIKICAADVERVHAFEISRDIFFGNVFPCDAQFICSVDNFVVNVGEILNVANFIAALCKKTANDIPRDKRAGVAYVRRIVRRHSAAINADLAFFLRLENFFRPAHRVVNFNHKKSVLQIFVDVFANFFGRKNFNGVVSVEAFHVARNYSVKVIRLGDGVLNGVFKVFPIQSKSGMNVFIGNVNDFNELEKNFEKLAHNRIIFQILFSQIVNIRDGRRRDKVIDFILISFRKRNRSRTH